MRHLLGMPFIWLAQAIGIIVGFFCYFSLRCHFDNSSSFLFYWSSGSGRII
ncbi:hypothetical protein [Lacticaseibacillus phage Lphi2ADMT26]|nr:hypothetical protein [Lacticaseibacillus phage Lphi2ADMT26]